MLMIAIIFWLHLPNTCTFWSLGGGDESTWSESLCLNPLQDTSIYTEKILNVGPRNLVHIQFFRFRHHAPLFRPIGYDL